MMPVKNRILTICLTRLLLIISFIFAASVQAADNPSYMISAANPHAAKAGLLMLSRGGSAVDAAIATQAMLTLAEPQSSGIGGGAFALHFNAADKTLETYDGRETAPAGVRDTHFLHPDKSKMKFYEAVVGGHAVGAPGVLAMLKKAHEKHGILPWADLFAPTIQLAEDGFAISERLHFLLNRDKFLKTKAAAAAYFYHADGSAKAVGTVLKNPELADSLRKIAHGGIDAFYNGPIAKKIIAAVTADAARPGLLSLSDLGRYEAKNPLQHPSRRKKRGCGASGYRRRPAHLL